jgi:hypothetical protein
MRSAEQFESAKRLIAAGVNDCAIARQIGVPRTTARLDEFVGPKAIAVPLAGVHYTA